MINFSPRNPYFYLGNIPVGLPLLMVIIQVASLIVGSLVGYGLFGYSVVANDSLLHGEVWRLFSYWFYVPVSIWLICFSWPFLYHTVDFLENYWSRARIIGCYIGLTVFLPVISLLLHFVGLPMTAWIGPDVPTIALFVVGAAICPEDQVTSFTKFLIIRKWLAVALVAAVALYYIGDRYPNLPNRLAAYFALMGMAYWVGRSSMDTGGASLFSHLRQSRRNLSLVKSSPKVPKSALAPRAQIVPEHPAVERVDALLDKIAKHGLDSLTKAERDTLQRSSQELREKEKDA